MNTRPQAPSEDAVWTDGKWLPLIDPRDTQEPLNPLVNFDHPAPSVTFDAARRTALYDSLLTTAERHHKLTGRHLNVFGDIAELYATIAHNIRFGRNDEAGREGRLGDDHYTVKCISPNNTSDTVNLDMSGNFSHVVVVKITADFRVSGRVIARKDLPGSSDQLRKLRWSALPETPFNPADR